MDPSGAFAGATRLFQESGVKAIKHVVSDVKHIAYQCCAAALITHLQRLWGGK